MTTLTPNIITNLKRMNEKYCNYVKDVTTPIYGCPDIRSKFTVEHTRQISTSFYHQL